MRLGKCCLPNPRLSRRATSDARQLRERAAKPPESLLVSNFNPEPSENRVYRYLRYVPISHRTWDNPCIEKYTYEWMADTVMDDGEESNRRRLEYKWNDFETKLEVLSKEVMDLTYDGISSPSRKLHYGAIDDSDRYLLPKRLLWLNTDELFAPRPIPTLPEIPQSPPLQLPQSQYPSWYFETRGRGLLGNFVNKKEHSFLDADLERRRRKLAKVDEIHAQIEEKRKDFEEIFAKEAIRLQQLRQQVLVEDPEALVTLIELSNRRHWLPSGLRREFRSVANPDAKVVLIELSFPDYSNHKFAISRLKNDKLKYASVTENKRILRGTLYSLVIRAAYIASRILEGTSYQTIAVNVSQDWFDRATGAVKSGVICSLQAQTRELVALNLLQVDPEACFKHLKGIVVPSLETLSPIRPIFVLNRKDERFIEAKDLSEILDREENLAAMPWDDFEHLVAQLFEWEFAKDGIEVRVTRASRDRGVDAILFDPDPLRGGKFVLQAKRYTRPVDVAAVRDLYGTVMNEGANRGILITTSSYGPDAYEFAKNKPLSLVDGPNLLFMLQRHGKKFRLDLAEARRLFEE
jgi:Restriction endonuclease